MTIAASKQNRDFPAQPCQRNGIEYDGLTKREAVAFGNMQRLLANYEASVSIQEEAIEAGNCPANYMARIAVNTADALFDELEKSADLAQLLADREVDNAT